MHGENNSGDACSAGDISFSYFGQSGQSRDVMSHEPVLVKALDMEWGGTLPCSAVFRRMRNDAYDFAGFALSKRCHVYEATRECERNVKAVG